MTLFVDSTLNHIFKFCYIVAEKQAVGSNKITFINIYL